MSGFYQNGYRVSHVSRPAAATSIENDALRVTVLHEGGHIAEILDKRTGINPLWIPPWPSIEPSAYDAARHPEYGGGAEAALLAGIMGHNLCLDIFGGPSPDEAAAGLPVHGEVSTARFAVDARRRPDRACTPCCRRRSCASNGASSSSNRAVRVHESVENLSAADRPIGWTQHVTLGPPFLEKGVDAVSRVRHAIASLRRRGRSRRHARARRRLRLAARAAPCRAAQKICASTQRRSAIERLHRASHGPGARRGVLRGVFTIRTAWRSATLWRRADFPWMGIWEENHSRTAAPWNGRTLTRGLEFGVSPMPEKRGGR